MKTKYKIGIRKEDKSFESRTPLLPVDIEDLLLQFKNSIEFYLERSRESDEIFVDENGKKVHLKQRCIPDDEYQKVGVMIVDDLSCCDVILGIKEIPHENVTDISGITKIINGFFPGKTFVFFSHTHKGQEYNLDMLWEMINQKCSLIDYELLVENVNEKEYEKVRKKLKGHMTPAAEFDRTVYFGKHAGIVGAIDTLWVFGKRMEYEGVKTPFSSLYQAIDYRDTSYSENEDTPEYKKGIHDYEKAKSAIIELGKEINSKGLPKDCPPIIIGITGKSTKSTSSKIKLGHSAEGASELISYLNPMVISPEMLEGPDFVPNLNQVYVVYFDRSHTSEDIFIKYLPKLTILINCLIWHRHDSRPVSIKNLKKIYSEPFSKSNQLRVIGDITCDPGGSIEPSKDTYSNEPYYIYHPHLDSDDNLKWEKEKDREENLFPTTCKINSVEGIGPVIVSITNLPCELPKEASRKFSKLLKEYVSEIAKVDGGEPSFDNLNVNRDVKRSVILYNGELTPDYQYLKEILDAYAATSKLKNPF